MARNVITTSIQRLPSVTVVSSNAYTRFILSHTVNGERFAGLNFRIFHGFQEHCKHFPMNFHFIIQTLYILPLF